MRRNRNNKNTFMKYIITGIIATITILLVLKIFPKEDNIEIQQLKSYNDSLRIINNKMNYEIISRINDINKKDSLVQKLYIKQNKLYHIIDTLNIQITNLNDRYEKANHHADSLNTYQLKRYFSNLK